MPKSARQALWGGWTCKSCGAELEIVGMGATGYAADVLESSMKVDVNIVETVAHMMSAVKYCGDIDVVCDIGGQDIKVLFIKNGDIANFRLSNSCSAGNGMLLQAMADQFGVKVTDYADVAFGAELSPKFSYGCAVFLDTDRVNFQKEGYSKEELLAGLAQVLPKNVWQYVVQIPRLAALGRKFVLQGGTQYNLAAVKAQVDYIKQRVPDGEVFVHPHTGEAGAIGAAFETLRIVKRRGRSTFIGMDAAIAAVVAGLVAAPVIAVPTSVGYGASFEGLAALLSMLNSCAPGVAVVNIDNGFGAGYLAAQINGMDQTDNG
jgi:activator of 2-hydroxyglutaryl-CoA dehydratase